MNTWTHLLVGAVVRRPIINKQAATEEPKLPPMRSGWFLFGSVLPDLMLIFMGLGAFVYDLARGAFTIADLRNGSGAGDGPPEAFQDSTIWRLFDDWYFTNPWVKAGHSIFGTPIPLILYLVIGYLLWKNLNVGGFGRKLAPALFWLAMGAIIHTAADIPLHTDDGPLLFWPLNWSYRFESPVSYWDPDHHGRTWSIFEGWLNIALIIWLIGSWVRRKAQARQQIQGS